MKPYHCHANGGVWQDSANGRHLCLVMPVLKLRLIDWRTNILETDHDVIYKLSYQVAKG